MRNRASMRWSAVLLVEAMRPWPQTSILLKNGLKFRKGIPRYPGPWVTVLLFLHVRTPTLSRTTTTTTVSTPAPHDNGDISATDARLYSPNPGAPWPAPPPFRTKREIAAALHAMHGNTSLAFVVRARSHRPPAWRHRRPRRRRRRLTDP